MAALDERPATTLESSDSHPDEVVGRRSINRHVVALIAVLLTMLVAGVVGTVWLSGPSLSPEDEQFLAAVASSPKLKAETDAEPQVVTTLGREWCGAIGDGVPRFRLFYAAATSGYSSEDMVALDRASLRVYCPQHQGRS